MIEAPVLIRNIRQFKWPAESIVPGVKVSAVIITYNEERNIRRTLSQLYWCDEIIIVDSHSSDKTVNICKEFGCNVFYRKFDGYGPQKRFAVSKANNDWVLCIDADEVLTDKLIDELTDTLKPGSEYAAFSFPMNLVFLNKEFVYGKESRRYFLRLFNKQKGGFTDDVIHEGIRVSGPVKKLRHTIRHYSYGSLSQYLEKFNRYSTYSAEAALRKGKNKSMIAIFLSLPINFIKNYFLEGNCLNGLKGFYWSVLSAFYTFTKYIKIKELHQNP
jgi:glycosyltransferase involved in cell wall biosynthesis